MKGIIIISAIVGLTLVGLCVVAKVKGLTLSEYLDSLWKDLRADIKQAEYIRKAQAAEKKGLFGEYLYRDETDERAG